METQWSHCYRMRPYFRNVALACTAVFLAIDLASTIFAYLSGRISAVLIFGVFWSAWVALGIYLLLLYYKYRLFTNDSALCQIGVLREQHADMNFVNELKWRGYPRGGSARLSGAFGVVKIELGNFESADREQLITFLRNVVEYSNQEGWEQFNQQFTDTPEKRQRLNRTKFWLAIFLFANAIAFFIMWVVGFGVGYLLIAVVNVIVGGRALRTLFGKENSTISS